jgi:hypothetical protein
MKFDGILFGTVALLSVASAFGGPPEEKANALAKIFGEPGLWGKDYPAALASLPAWNRLGEKRVWMFADRIIGGSPHKTREEAQGEAERFTEAVKALRPRPAPKFEALLKERTEQLSAAKMEVIPFFQDISWQPIASGVPTNPVQRFQAGFSLLTVRIISGSAFAYRPNASTHGPPTSSAVLANLGDFLCGITCETSEKRDQLGSGK